MRWTPTGMDYNDDVDDDNNAYDHGILLSIIRLFFVASH